MLTAPTMGDQYRARTFTAIQTRAKVKRTVPAEKRATRRALPVAIPWITTDPHRMGMNGTIVRVVDSPFTTLTRTLGLNEVSMTRIMTTRRTSLRANAPLRARPETSELTAVDRGPEDLHQDASGEEREYAHQGDADPERPEPEGEGGSERNPEKDRGKGRVVVGHGDGDAMTYSVCVMGSQFTVSLAENFDETLSSKSMPPSSTELGTKVGTKINASLTRLATAV